MGTSVSVQEGFVLSRVDGESSVETICMVSGLGRETTLEALQQLHAKGVILFGEEKEEEEGSASASGSGSISGEHLLDQFSNSGQFPRGASQSRDMGGASQSRDIGMFSDSMDVGPSEEERGKRLGQTVSERIDAFFQRLDQVNFYQILEIEPTVDFRTIKHAYYGRAKEFHPDRYFRQDLGDRKQSLNQIFKQIRMAYVYLKDDEQRVRYYQHILEMRDQANHAWDEAPRKPQAARQENQKKGAPPKKAAQQPEAQKEKPKPRKTPAKQKEQEASRPDKYQERRRKQRERQIPTAAELEERQRRPSSEVLTNESRKQEAGKSFQRGMDQLDSGEYLAAVSSFRTALTYCPESVEFKKRYNFAVNKSREVTAETYFNRGLVEEKAKHYELAASLFSKATAIVASEEYLCKAAEAAVMCADLIKAQEYGRKALRQWPDSARARYLMGRILLDADNKEGALEELHQALKIDPSHVEARQLLEKLQ